MSRETYHVFSIDPNGPWDCVNDENKCYLFTTTEDPETIDSWEHGDFKIGDEVFAFMPHERPEGGMNEYGMGFIAILKKFRKVKPEHLREGDNPETYLVSLDVGRDA